MWQSSRPRQAEAPGAVALLTLPAAVVTASSIPIQATETIVAPTVPAPAATVIVPTAVLVPQMLPTAAPGARAEPSTEALTPTPGTLLAESTRNSETLPPTAPAYDLYVKRINFQPDEANLVAGQPVRFNLLIATDIYPPSGPLFPTARMRWRAGADMEWQEALCPADMHYAKCDGVVEFTYAEPGIYDMTVEVDHRGEIAETNERNNSSRVILLVQPVPVPTTAPTAAPKPQAVYSALTFSADFDYTAMLPVNAGKSFPYGTKIVYAYWTYSGVVPDTVFDFDWYRDGTLVDSQSNRFTTGAGKAHEWLNYGYSPQDPLDAGSYRFSVRVNGKVVLSDTFVIEPQTIGGPIPGAISVFFTIQNGNPTGWVYDRQGMKHTPQYGTISGIPVSPGDRIVLQTDQARFSLLFDCSTTPGTFTPCDFSADSTGNLPGEIRAVKSGMSGYLNISRADNWARFRSGFEPQRYPADPVLRIVFQW